MRRFAEIAAACALFLLAAAGQAWMAHRRPGGRALADDGVAATLGGLRSIVSEAVWFRAEALQEEGRYVELAQLASVLAHLEPHTPEVWSYAAWNLAYNISVMMPSAADRWRWVLAGLRLLRDEGMRLNPADPLLCRELAWMFELKIGGDLDEAAPFYRERWREIVRDAAVRDAWGELGMDEEVMAECERLYGIADWGLAHASAVYWSVVGLRTATGTDAAFLRSIRDYSARVIENGGVFRPARPGADGEAAP